MEGWVPIKVLTSYVTQSVSPKSHTSLHMMTANYHKEEEDTISNQAIGSQYYVINLIIFYLVGRGPRPLDNTS